MIKHLRALVASYVGRPGMHPNVVSSETHTAHAAMCVAAKAKA
jgi:hypothetical protein